MKLLSPLYGVVGFAAISMVAGCLPTDTGSGSPAAPDIQTIFDPDPDHNFATDSGSVTLNGLTSSSAICYTLDGTTPSYNGGTCSGGSTAAYTGNAIALSCGSDTAAITFRTIKVVFDWASGEVSRSASFRLDCTPPPPDADNDGVPDTTDNCPNDSNPDQADSDSNGVGDVCDNGEPIADMDGDTRADDIDNCQAVWNQNQGDDDNDGIGNVCDTEPQGPDPVLWANDDMVAAFVDWKDEVQCNIRCSDPTGGGNMGTYSCPGGGTANWTVDVDVFGGKANSTFTYSNCNYTTGNGVNLTVNGKLIQYSDFNGNGKERTDQGALTVTGDYTGAMQSFAEFHNRTRDGGYFTASCSTDPLPNEICAPNNMETNHYYPDWACGAGICPEPRPALTDGDGDGVFDIYDNCPAVSNPNQANADFDSMGDACDDSTSTTDTDGDGVPDDADNCPGTYNPTQDDEDGDGLGDECDDVLNPDSDGDGIVDGPDNCRDTPNPGQEDFDNDGAGDACDSTPQGPDSDDDGVPDLLDNCPNDVNNSQSDADNDGIGDPCDPDPGFVMLFYNVGAEPGRCLQDNVSNIDIWGSQVKSVSGCDSSNAKNQWQIIDIPSGPTAVKLFKNLQTNECLENFDILGWMNLRTSGCDTNNNGQQWTIERYNDNFDFRFPSRLHAVNRNSCIYTNGTGDVFGTEGNCNLQGTEDNRQMGIYFSGDFFGSEPYEP